jgi:hypothetical protein
VQKAAIRPLVWIIAVKLAKLQANVLKLVNKKRGAGVKSGSFTFITFSKLNLTQPT